MQKKIILMVIAEIVLSIGLAFSLYYWFDYTMKSVVITGLVFLVVGVFTSISVVKSVNRKNQNKNR